MGQLLSDWSIYRRVPDVDQTLSRGINLGGKTCVPALEAPGVGPIARLNDPAGAGFYLISLSAN